METHYTTLRTLVAIARENPNPVQYLCKPREMILHSTFDWELIHKHLLKLEQEEFVRLSQADTLQFSITQKGLDKISAVSSVTEKVLAPFVHDSFAKNQ